MRAIVFIIFSVVAVFSQDLTFDKSILKGELENGLKYYIAENNSTKNTAYFYLNIAAGSVHESDLQQGFAHFVEHMAFNGSKHFKKNELIKIAQNMGVKFGPDLNAATSHLNTLYNLKINVSDENIKTAFDILHDYIDGLEFDEIEVQKEKGVILEEAKRNVLTRLYEKRADYLYPNSIYSKRFPIGKNDIISNATRQDLVNFYKANYQPKLASIAVIGDINATNIENFIKINFKNLKNSNLENKPNLSLKPFTKTTANIHDSEIGTNIINIIFHDNFLPINTKNAFKRYILDRYINALLDLSYKKINQERKSPLSVKYSNDHLFKQVKLNIFSTNVFENDFNTSLNNIFSLIKGIREFGFLKDDFESVKKQFLKSNQNRFLRNLSQNDEIYMLLDYIQNQTIKLSKKDYYDLSNEILNEISFDDVNEYFKKITQNDEKIVEFISQTPVNLSDTQIDQIYKNATAYQTNKQIKTETSFLQKKLDKKPFKSEKYDKQNDFFIIDLQNNAKVILKNQKNQKNQVQFLAVKKGGATNHDDIHQAQIAIRALNSGTVGDIGKYEALKIKSNYSYKLNNFLSDTLTFAKGTSSKDDLKALLEEFYVSFNNPKLHESEFLILKQKIQNEIKEQNKTSSYRFESEFLDLVYNSNNKKRFLKIQDLQKADLKNLQEIMNLSYKNAFGYHFFIIGDIDINATKELVSIYLANLSSNPVNLQIKDDEAFSQKGSFELIKNYGDSDKSEVDMYFINDNLKEYLEENFYKYQAFSQVLRMIILEKIREDSGQIYSAAVSSKYEQYPHVRSSLLISFSCDEKNAKNIEQQIKNILQDIAKNGVHERYLNNFKKSNIIDTKIQAQTNIFWINKLANHYLYNVDIYNEKAYEKMINKINQNDIKKCANDMLNANYFLGILNPKK